MLGFMITPECFNRPVSDSVLFTANIRLLTVFMDQRITTVYFHLPSWSLTIVNSMMKIIIIIKYNNTGLENVLRFSRHRILELHLHVTRKARINIYSTSLSIPATT
jgi:hypothetical protein